MGGGVVLQLGSKLLVVGAVLRAAGGKALGMALEQVRLLDLTAVRQAYFLDAKVVGGVVCVVGDLTP